MKRVYLVLLLPLLILAWVWWLAKYLWAIAADPVHAWQLAVAKDQLANAAFNGSEDETISSRAGRHKNDEKWACWLCWLLDHIDPNHCEKSIGV
jgi:hypothetical protein